MTDYTRTAIRSLSIKGFRSIRSLELENIPDLVVLHGPNGCGKSNLLLAAELAIRAATLPGELPVTQESAAIVSLADADKLLKLRPDDFCNGEDPKIQIAITLVLGSRALGLLKLKASDYEPNPELSMRLVIEQLNSSTLRYWFAKASFGAVPVEKIEVLQIGGIVVSGPPSPNYRPWFGTSQQVAARIRYGLLSQLLQVSPAYRVPGSEADPETALFHSFLSENRLERQATERLSRRLSKAKLFSPKGDSTDSVKLIPVESGTYKEKQVRISHLTGGELPLRNLGSGEQQVIFMLAQRVITPFPIAFLEEPEAHLHTSLMGPFAQVLLDSVTGDGGVPDVDQLWIATHHHHFALALEYFDMQLVDGATQVTRLPRAKAAPHFFEPGPIWEALRQLASSAKQREAVVFRAADGAPVTAGQILDSIEKDPMQQVAKDYAKAVTEAMVLAMRQRAEKAEGPKE